MFAIFRSRKSKLETKYKQLLDEAYRLSHVDRKKSDFKTAEADGFEFAKRLDRVADIPAMVKQWLDFPGPAFLEVIIDPDAGVYPMVGPGLAYDAMITGDFIPNRGDSAPDEETDSNSMF